MDLNNIQLQNKRKVKVTFFYLLLVGGIIVSASILIHRVIGERGDAPRAGLREMFEFLPFISREPVRGINVAILRSGFTADYIRSISNDPASEDNYNQMSELWLDYLQRANIRSSVITDSDIIAGLDEYNLLILPMTICLSQQQITSIKRFLSQGRGVILTHASGNRDQRGNLRQWSLASDLTGSGGFHFLHPGEEGNIATLVTSGESPITAGMAPGRQIRVHTYDSPAGIKLLEPRVRSFGFWQDDNVRFAPIEHTDKDVAAARGAYMSGRFVWLGFTMRSVADLDGSWGMFNVILQNALNWTTHKTVASKGTWPAGQGGAAVFAVKAEYDFLEALNIVTYFKLLGIEPMVFIAPDPADINLAAIHRISANAELAPFFPPESEVISMAQGEIERILRAVSSSMDAEFNVGSEGFLLCGEEKETTALINAAFRSRTGYVWLTGSYNILPKLLRSGLPQPVFRRRNHPVFFFGNANSLLKYYEYGLNNPGVLLRDIKKEMENVMRSEGILPVIIQPEHIRRSDLEKIMPDFLEYLRENDVMTLSVLETSDWWRNYENIQISAEEDRPRRISIIISNTGVSSMPAMKVYIYPSSMPSEIRIQAEKIRIPVPNHTLDHENGRIILDIENLSAAESRTYFISF